MATGVPSRRPKDVDYKEAIVDKATQAEFIKRESLAPGLCQNYRRLII
jgi:hypothetical protein